MTRKSFEVTRRGALLTTAAAAVVAGLGRLSGPSYAAAPMLGVSRPQFYRFKLGDFEITTVLDGAIQLDGPHPIFGNNQSADEVQKYADENRLPTERHEIAFTPTLVNTGNELILFDGGNGAARREMGAGKLLSMLPTVGYQPDQIDIVVVTHGHGDHIGGLMEDGKPAYPNARYVASETDFDFWSKPDDAPDAAKPTAELYVKNVVPHKDKLTLVSPDDEVVSGIRGVDAFGHTPGHMAFHIESGGKQLLLWADTSNHYILSVQKPEWHVAFDIQKDKAVETRKRIFDMVATDKIPVIGYHMPPPSVGYLEKSGDGYRWAQASYELNL